MSELERINPQSIRDTRPETTSEQFPASADIEAIAEQKRALWNEDLDRAVGCRFKDATFETYDRSVQPKAYERAREFVEGYFSGAGPLALVLCSKTPGLGKSHLFASIARVMMARSEAARWERYSAGEATYGLPYIRGLPSPVFYVNETELLSMVRATYKDACQDDELHLFARLNRYPLLIVDDVGKTAKLDQDSGRVIATPATQTVYYRLVEYRWANCKHIAIAANLMGRELDYYFGAPLASRLLQMTQGRYFIEMTGEDYRIRGIQAQKEGK
jgi:DNA replication protein DnaC